MHARQTACEMLKHLPCAKRCDDLLGLQQLAELLVVCAEVGTAGLDQARHLVSLMIKDYRQRHSRLRACRHSHYPRCQSSAPNRALL